MYCPWKNEESWEQSDLHLKKYSASAYQRASEKFDSTIGIHTLLGPRRIGKTTQFKLWIKDAIGKFGAENVFYLDAERFDTWKELIQILEPIKYGALFIDEITSVDEWPRALKILADEGNLEKVCVWVTGSNAFDLKSAGEWLPGRRGKELEIRDMELLPLTFKEFYYAVKSKYGESNKELFDLFCLWGGYPMAVSECLSRDLPSYDLLNELLDVILGETSRKHKSIRLTTAVSSLIYNRLGSKISYNSIAKHLDSASHPIARQYVELLEGAYSVIQVERYNPKTKQGILRKEKKIYFFDPLTMAAIISRAETGAVDPSWLKERMKDTAKHGAFLENVVASELKKMGFEIFYDEQHGGEIDFVYFRPAEKTRAIEVKRSFPGLIEMKPLSAYHNGELWVYEKNQPVNGISMACIYDRLLSF